MSYIGLDLGNKRVWIAISEQNIAFAQEIVSRVEIISYLKEIFIENKNITKIVVWLPYDLYGKDTKQLERTQKFIEKLKNIFLEKEVIGHDERFSSFYANEGYSDHRDDIAAQCILQSYLDSKEK